MAKGISIHIGINRVDPNQYGGWDGQLTACEFDAKDMQAIAEARGFQSKLILTESATYENVTNAIVEAAAELKQGDILFLTYSGHGGQIPDLNGDEDDEKDETWVLYDRQLIDDELYGLWSKFEKGVRIVMLSDSCHSGTMARLSTYKTLSQEFSSNGQPIFRILPNEIAKKNYQAHREVYDQIPNSFPAADKVEIGASVLLLSGCLDNQFSSDGDRNGLFTKTLLETWNQGKFKGSYYKFYKRILRQMPPWQSPNFFKVGVPNPGFERQSPLTI